MYIHRHDAKDAVAIWVFDRPTVDEWGLHFEHLRDVAAWSSRTGKRGATMIISRNFERPDPKRRAELAQCTDAPGYDPYVAFVAPNTAMRALLTMFRWMQTTPKYEMEFVPSSHDGLTWLEEKRGERLRNLRELLVEIRVEYRRAGGEPP